MSQFFYTRLTKETGWTWYKGDPGGRNTYEIYPYNTYSFLIPVFQELEIRDKPYFIGTQGHCVLRLDKTIGKKVDERENYIYYVNTFSKLTPDETDRIYGIKLILTLLRGGGRFIVPENRLREAISYAAKHLPPQYAERLRVSQDEEAPGMITAVTDKQEVKADARLHRDETHWVNYLPEFTKDDDDLAETLCSENFGYTPEYMLQLFAYKNGAEFCSDWQKPFLKFFRGKGKLSDDLKLKYVKDVGQDAIDADELLPLLKHRPPEQWSQPWINIKLRETDSKPQKKLPEKELKDYENAYIARFRYAVDRRTPQSIDLSNATPYEVYKIYEEIEYRHLTLEEVSVHLGRDDNSRSIISYMKWDPNNKKEKVRGYLPAILYLYNILSLNDCIRAYGDKKTAFDIIDSMTEQCLPPLLQVRALKKILPLIHKE